MTETKFTPGPWETDEDEQRIDGIGRVKMLKVISPDGKVVCEFSNATCQEISTEICDDDLRHTDWLINANAALIASAPDLYAALVKAKQQLWIDASLTWTKADFLNWAVVQEINAALSKARGQS